MSEFREVAPIVEVYGENAIDLALEEIKNLEFCSNFPFTGDYVKLGISFLNHKALEIIEGKKRKCSLESLISESFGEAAIYKFQVEPTLGK